MNGLRKPRQVRWQPRDPIALTLNRVDKLSSRELAQVMNPTKDAFTRLREGVATEYEWKLLASAVEVALAIERQGVVRGLKEHLQSAEQALQAIKQRAMVTGIWCPTPLYYQELDNIKAIVHLHEHQLRQLSAGEYKDAVQVARENVLSDGGQVLKQASTAPNNAVQGQLV